MMMRRIMLAILALVLLTACSLGQERDVRVQLSEFKFEASRTAFSPGQTYRFVVTNTGQTKHELMITEPGAPGHASHDPHAGALLMVHDLQPGESRTVEVTFPEHSGASAMEFSCHEPGHYEAGMKLPITVGDS